MQIKNVFLLGLCIVLSSAAQVLFKFAQDGSKIHGSIVLQVFQIVKNPFLVSGLLLYTISAFLWLRVVRVNEVSRVYPFMSVGYILVLVAGFLFFGEALSMTKIIGISIVVVGIVVLTL